MFVINHATKIPGGSLSSRKIAKRIRRRDQRLEAYVNSPHDGTQPPAQTPKITSTIAESPAGDALSLESPDRLLDC